MAETLDQFINKVTMRLDIFENVKPTRNIGHAMEALQWLSEDTTCGPQFTWSIKRVPSTIPYQIEIVHGMRKTAVGAYKDNLALGICIEIAKMYGVEVKIEQKGGENGKQGSGHSESTGDGEVAEREQDSPQKPNGDQSDTCGSS